ncbi:DUF4349 domain-containing protein [Streptomyces gardneri]|uniref:DUF4349 domain-containing protein n=1 Tax=Nocardia TaxID=1817 RepID=UPI00135C0CD9|nr:MULTISPECIES: DUF4349 domain-containing protein [Nocardia]MBF6167299.1 DUF4349 domain-containing protein [Streptomyces gardneri]UAK33066.1 DUF4349 domain-containing protein [Nocardia asteroides]
MRKLAVLCVGVLGLILLAGCGDEDATPAPDRSSAIVTGPAPAIVPPGVHELAPPKRDNSGGEPMSARKEVITGTVEITADAPVAAAGTIIDRVRAAGGRVDSRTEQPGTDDTEPSATLVVRMPADKTDAFIADLGGVGQVTRVTTNRDDVTMQWEDLDARIKALQTSVERLRALIAGATTTSDLIAAEQALSSRQGELDSLTAQKRRLDDQVALSTLTIEITSEHNKSDDDPDSFWDGIVSGWHSLVNWLQDAVVFSGKAIPWLGFLAVAVAVVWGIARLVRRRKPASSREESAPALAEPASSAASPQDAETSAGGKRAHGGKGDDQAEQP